MFSQSFLMSDITYRSILNPPDVEVAKTPPKTLHKKESEDLEVIEESPNNECSKLGTTTLMRSIRGLRTDSKLKKSFRKNKSDSIIMLDTAKPILKTKSNENFSEYFRSQMNFEEPTKTAVPLNKNESVGKYFKESMDFDAEFNRSSNKPKEEAIQLSKLFNGSDFEADDNNKSDYFDKPIFSQDVQSESINLSANHSKIEQNPNIDRLFENVEWEESGDFNLSEKQQNKLSQTHLFVDEAVALGIDNVPFTQEFLKHESLENNLNANGSSNREKSVSNFIEEEMRMCQRSVQMELSENFPAKEPIAPTLSNISNLNLKHDESLANKSNFVLNWSTEHEEEKQHVAKKTTIVQKNSILLNKNLNQIDNWGLPFTIVEEYSKKGIKTMFDWQTECLSNTKVLFESANLVYSAPTSAGKTLVSEMLMIKNVIEKKKTSLLILPFISVVREKLFYLQDLLTSSDIIVEGFFGGYTSHHSIDHTNIAVCTIEKANSIINKLLEQRKIETIGCIVVDEIHLISDPGRGYILELLLAKILYVCEKFGYQIQIISMSATLPNLDLLTKWLKAEFYFTDFRPVELNEMIKINSDIYDNQLKVMRKVCDKDYVALHKDQDNVGQLCVETILEGCSVIIFCPSKDWCESLSNHVASYIYSIGKSKTDLGERLRSHINMEMIEEIKEQLRNCPTGLDTVLEKILSYACAFHHAGLTTDERDIVESSFKSGAIKVIVATSTLSSGVNLPARRVIIRTPLFGGKIMNALTYKQMIGRAGRTGKDTLGESILICSDANAKSGKELVSSELKPLSSCLDSDNNTHLKRALLEIIASGMATTRGDVENFANCTLLSSEKSISFEYFQQDSMTKEGKSKTSQIINEDEANADDPIGTCMRFLIKYEFIRLQLKEDTNEMCYVSTRLGSACLASSMPPNDGFLLFSELQNARQCFVLESELHAVYLVTPFSVCYQMQNIDWLSFLDLWEKLPSSMRRVGELVGVKDSFLVKAMRNHKLDYKTLQIHKRFYTALALQELVNEANINEVAEKYKCSRGLLQSLQQMASTFAGIVTSFCTALNWNLLAIIIAQFQERLFFGVHRDLIELMKLAHLNGQRARALYNAGFTTLSELANADVFIIEKILYNCISFDSKKRDGENDYDADRRNKIRYLFVTGKSGITVREAAKLIIDDSRRHLEQELGLQNVIWSQTKRNDEHSQSVVAKHDQITVQNSTNLMVAPIVPSESIAKSKPTVSSKPNKIESEDLFHQSESPNKSLNEITNNKRKSSERIEAQDPSPPKQQKIPPTKAANKSVTRRSPRIKQQQVNKENSKIISPLQNHPNNDLFCDSFVDVNTQLLNAINQPLNVSNETIQNSQPTPTITRKTQSRVLRSQRQTASTKTTDLTTDNVDTINFTNFQTTISTAAHILSVNKHEDSESLLTTLKVVNVFGNLTFFKKFKEELLRHNELSLSIGVGQYLNKTKIIGNNLLINQMNGNESQDLDTFNCRFDDDLYVAGVAVCIADSNAYYLNLQTGMANDPKISHSMKLEFLCSIFAREELTLKMFDAKEQCKILLKVLPNLSKISTKLEDPKIAHWLLQPDVECNLIQMAEQYAAECVGIAEMGGSSNYCGSIGLHYKCSISPRIRSVVECVSCLHILREQTEKLKQLGNGDIYKSFIEMEMPVQLSLIHMETIGFPICQEEMSTVRQDVSEIMITLEKKLYAMHGQRFNITSSRDVARVLKLNSTKQSGKTISTAKKVLEKMVHPMSDLIVQHRKLNSIINNTIYPLLRCIVNERIYGNSFSLTSTGRITMQEPNLQNVAKDFQIEIDSETHNISCRSAFQTNSKRSLISADFCQLELRILSHLSQDADLLAVMSSKSDIFTSVTSKWRQIPDSQVSEKLRNETKQICYGIIYGMGVTSLAEQLKCDEEEAKNYSDAFHRTYPGIRIYIAKVIKFVREHGYVETLAGRRRYFSQINSENAATRAQAERQAINTIIQGSAADISKYAILRMERNLQKYQKPLKINLADNELSTVAFILHLHDELIYEVPSDKSKQIAKILKSSMENCAKLSVPLNVKVKIGRSWGALNVVDV